MAQAASGPAGDVVATFRRLDFYRNRPLGCDVVGGSPVLGVAALGDKISDELVDHFIHRESAAHTSTLSMPTRMFSSGFQSLLADLASIGFAPRHSWGLSSC
jgi:hypothetical protein